MDLGGTWRAAAADEALRRVYPAPAFDDAGWEPVVVPSHWRSTPAFGSSDGPLLYRHRFEAPPPAAGRRSWLTFDGVFYDGDVWLDGGYVGATEGYFFPHTFEVAEATAAGPEHFLAVEVGCSNPSDRKAKRALTGVFQHWDCHDPDWNPGGIWRPVRLEETGPVRLARLRVLCAEATAERAQLDVRAVLDAASAVTVLLHTRVTLGTEMVAERLSRHTLAGGENRIRLAVAVEQPALWWPHALGDQPLHDIQLQVLVPTGDHTPPDTPRRRSRSRDEEVTAEEAHGHVPSDVRTVRSGLRQVRMNNWIITVNGERLFVKGSNQGPTRMALAEATADDLERDVVLARAAGLDLLRVHAHVSRPELYDAADRHGLLLWQDLPLQWAYARSVRKQAVRQAREAVDLLGHHPSIVLWCGHNEPFHIDTDAADPAHATATALKYAASQELPSWNKTVLDTSIGRALERADPSRPVVRHSGVWPGPASGGTDSHLYFGWYHGTERDLPRLLAAVPRMARFVTEFGAQAVPPTADWMRPGEWPALDWQYLGHHHALQRSVFDRFVPPADFPTFDAWRDATQDYQATVIRYHIETLRRLKYRPTGGFCHFSFADGYPAVSWSVLDHERRPKTGYAALAASCAPVIVVATRPLAGYEPGADLVLDVHVVSDLRRPLTDARVVATLGGQRWGWAGTIDADSSVLVGTIRGTAEEGDLVVTLTADELTATSTYPVAITR